MGSQVPARVRLHAAYLLGPLVPLLGLGTLIPCVRCGTLDCLGGAKWRKKAKVYRTKGRPGCGAVGLASRGLSETDLDPMRMRPREATRPRGGRDVGDTRLGAGDAGTSRRSAYRWTQSRPGTSTVPTVPASRRRTWSSASSRIAGSQVSTASNQVRAPVAPMRCVCVCVSMCV